MLLSILLTVSVLLPVIGASNNTLTSKEDLSNIEFDLNAEEKDLDKNKRELPKVQSVIINILKVGSAFIVWAVQQIISRNISVVRYCNIV